MLLRCARKAPLTSSSLLDNEDGTSPTRRDAASIEDAKSAVLLEIVSLETAGDHHLALCEVVDWENIEGKGEPLYTGDLPK